MKYRNSVLGFIAAVSLTLRDGDAAHAQGHGVAQDVQTDAGDLFGDRLGSRQEPSAHALLEPRQGSAHSGRR
jgi:hypothetical protein